MYMVGVVEQSASVICSPRNVFDESFCVIVA
jgi:hypothetical protein